MTEVVSPPAARVQSGVLDALARSSLFGALGSPLVEDVAAGATVRNVRRGERIWDRGSPATVLALVAAGRLKCWCPGRDSRQWVNTVVRPGGHSGLAACVDRGPNTCHAEPLERSRIVLIPTAAVRAAMQKSPAFAIEVAVCLAGDARRLLSACEDVTLRTPVERLARYLVAQSSGAAEFELRETQTQIAAQLGTVREVVGRGLRHLGARGLIGRTGRTVRVLLPQDLAALASGAAV